jgi:hypothetical protein
MALPTPRALPKFWRAIFSCHKTFVVKKIAAWVVGGGTGVPTLPTPKRSIDAAAAGGAINLTSTKATTDRTSENVAINARKRFIVLDFLISQNIGNLVKR